MGRESGREAGADSIFHDTREMCIRDSPWDSWGSNPALSYPTPAAPVTQPANMSCPSTEGGVLEQQFPVAMAYV